ncbi:hypothetical protein EDI_263620 [Entamoeba dispar SAW760]|uniref:Prefoldin subunit n=1 Tax=Entamoeba dispar (strain ATCC PRA-260 / SAW760) TaxID=370354 RepID=B0ECJ3_ENTDS|nr:uncharacterized protein EDI_263620 [Entamoeba dispar SAW760]EDR27753.1 hypothetical protein EDI_263620 [Entamoeba dispar SAW760]|eukprot:EDR27753.1 hypothetical protein EDI_263620 [Entamoeba dispar SAW760]
MEEYQSSVRQYNNVHSRMMMMKKELYRMEIVIDELQVQPKETYVALGKAFVLSDYDKLKKDIKEKHDNLENDIKKLEPMDASLAQKVNDAQEKLIKSMKTQQK